MDKMDTPVVEEQLGIMEALATLVVLVIKVIQVVKEPTEQVLLY